MSATTDRAIGSQTTLLWALIAVFVLALCARVGFLMTRGVTLSADSADYVRLAENIRAHGVFSLEAGSGFTPTIRRAPMYPMFLTAFVLSGTTWTKAIAVTQSILDAGVAALILVMAVTVTSLRWAMVSAVAYALHPGSIYFSTTILSEPLFTALLIVGVLLVLYALRSNRLLLSALAGAVMGMAILCRPIALPIPLLLIIVARLGGSPRRFWLHAGLLVICVTLVVSPWLFRCARVSGHFVFVQGYTPTLLYIATLTDWDQKDQEHLWARFIAEDPYGRRLNRARTPAEVVEADRYGLSLALQNIEDRPRSYLSSRIRNFPYLFITSFDVATGVNKSFGRLIGERAVLSILLKILLLGTFSLLPFLLACIGVMESRRNVTVALCATIWIYTLFINFPVWIEYRYWVPAVPFLLVSAAAGAQRIGTWLTARKSTLAKQP